MVSTFIFAVFISKGLFLLLNSFLSSPDADLNVTSTSAFEGSFTFTSPLVVSIL